MSWTFQIIHNAVTTSVTPLYSTLLFRDVQEKEQVFKRRKLETEFVFEKTDFDVLLAIDQGANRCSKIKFEVFLDASIYWTGQLKLVNAKNWDLDLCRVSIKPDFDDAYTAVFDTWKDELNIHSVAPVVSVSSIIGDVVTQDCIDHPLIGNWPYVPVDCTDAVKWKLIEFDATNGVTTTVSTYAREELTTACIGGVPDPPPGDGWVLVSDDCVGLNTATYARELGLYLIQDTLTDLAISRIYGITGYENGDSIVYPNGRKLEDVLEFFASGIGYTIESNFLNINPSGSTPSNVAYTASDSNLHNLLIFQKTDIKHPLYAQQAFLGKKNFEEVLNWLRDTVQAYWITVGSVLKIEHVSFFSEANGMDLTATNPAEIKGFSSYVYESLSMPKYERFNWQEKYGDTDFDGTDILYSNSCSNESEVKEITVENIVTDITSVAENGDDVSDDGFVLVASTLYLGSLFIISETGALSGESKLNGHLSWANLHSNYWTFERPQISGTMNDSDTVFDSSIPIKKQPSIQIKMTKSDYLNLNSNEKIKTNLGWGKVVSLIYNATSCVLQIELSYE